MTTKEAKLIAERIALESQNNSLMQENQQLRNALDRIRGVAPLTEASRIAREAIEEIDKPKNNIMHDQDSQCLLPVLRQ